MMNIPKITQQGVPPIIVTPEDGVVQFQFFGTPLRQVLALRSGNDLFNLNDFHRTALVEFDPNVASTITLTLLGRAIVDGTAQDNRVSAIGIFQSTADAPTQLPLPNVPLGSVGTDIDIAEVDVSNGLPWATLAFTAVAESSAPDGLPTFIGDPLVILVPKRN